MGWENKKVRNKKREVILLSVFMGNKTYLHDQPLQRTVSWCDFKGESMGF